MRKLMLHTGLLCLSCSASAIINPNLKPAFADVTWYANRNIVKQQMISKGYVFVGEVKSGTSIDVSFTGKLLGIPVNVRHYFNKSNQLVKTNIVFEKSYTSSLKSSFDSVRGSLTNKYGAGEDLIDVDKNYTSNDILIEMELKRGKKMSSLWTFPVNKYYIGLDLTQIYLNDDSYYLNLAYESPAWSKELDSRNQSNDF